VVMPFHQLVFQDHRIILLINIKIVWYVRRMYYKSEIVELYSHH